MRLLGQLWRRVLGPTFVGDEIAPPSVGSRVRAGMQFLDRVEPGWRSRVNPETLDLARCDRCVLGQLYGSYGQGTSRHALTLAEVIDYGFQTSAVFDTSGTWPTFEAGCRPLTAEWRRQLTAGS